MCASHSKEKEKKGIIERPVQGERCSPKIIWPPPSLFSPQYISSSKCLGLVTLLRKTSNALLASLWSRFSLQYILFNAFSILFSGILSFLLYLTLKLKNRIHKECSNLMHWCFCFIFPTQTKERGRGGAGSVNINIVFLLQIFLSNILYQWGVESTVESSVDSEDGNWWILYAAIGGALLLLLLVIGVVGCVVCCRKRFFILTVDLIGITSVCCERSDHHHSCLFSFFHLQSGAQARKKQQPSMNLGTLRILTAKQLLCSERWIGTFI